MPLGVPPVDPADTDPDIAAERLRGIVGTGYGPTHVTVPRKWLGVVLARLAELEDEQL